MTSPLGVLREIIGGAVDEGSLDDVSEREANDALAQVEALVKCAADPVDGGTYYECRMCHRRWGKHDEDCAVLPFIGGET